jgi:hypothetical protein
VQNTAENALQELKQLADQTDRLVKTLTRTAEALEKTSTSVLYAVTGGCLGTLASIAIVHYVAVSMFLISPPVTGLGLAGGLLFSRGFRRPRIESRIAEARLFEKDILDRVKNLPRNAPQEVRDELWTSYRKINTAIERLSMQFLRLDNRQAEALPAPQEQPVSLPEPPTPSPS